MDEHFGVHRGREDRAHILELAAQLGGVDEVPVVGERDVPVAKPGEDRLRVVEGRGPGGAVPCVANARVSWELIQRAAIDAFRYESHGTKGASRAMLIH